MFFNGLRMEMEDQFRVNASFSRDVWHLSVADLRRFRVLVCPIQFKGGEFALTRDNK